MARAEIAEWGGLASMSFARASFSDARACLKTSLNWSLKMEELICSDMSSMSLRMLLGMLLPLDCTG